MLHVIGYAEHVLIITQPERPAEMTMHRSLLRYSFLSRTLRTNDAENENIVVLVPTLSPVLEQVKFMESVQRSVREGFHCRPASTPYIFVSQAIEPNSKSVICENSAVADESDISISE